METVDMPAAYTGAPNRKPLKAVIFSFLLRQTDSFKFDHNMKVYCATFIKRWFIKH